MSKGDLFAVKASLFFKHTVNRNLRFNTSFLPITRLFFFQYFRQIADKLPLRILRDLRRKRKHASSLNDTKQRFRGASEQQPKTLEPTCPADEMFTLMLRSLTILDYPFKPEIEINKSNLYLSLRLQQEGKHAMWLQWCKNNQYPTLWLEQRKKFIIDQLTIQ
jgi:hypothetical protein